MTAITIENLNFGYVKKQTILSNINIEVPRGSVYGFLGANGAGKTTSLKLIMGLLKPTKGDIYLLGESIRKRYPKHLNNIGSLIESPSLYDHLPANDNLKIWCNYFKVSKTRIDEVLEIVNLSDSKKNKAGTFSTGMRQRLGLATTLLHDPEILILDEPTNGLDPMGMIAFRAIIKNLQDSGKTILLSSHILSEVERMVTKIGIIKDGQVVFEGSMDQLKELKQKDLQVKLRVSQPTNALSIIDAMNKNITTDNEIHFTLKHENELPSIIKKLVLADIDIYEVTPMSNDLENMFLSVTNKPT